MQLRRDSAKRFQLHLVRGGALFALMLLPLLSCVVRAAEPMAPKRVLVLYYYGKDHPANVEFEQGFQAALQSAPAGAAVEYYAEYLEPNRFPGESQSLALRDYLHRKYADRKIDVAIAQTDMALNFLLSYRADLFPDTPLVFFARKHPELSGQAVGPGLTGVVAADSYKNTLNLALTLHPATEQVLIVVGAPDDDKTLETIVRKQLREFEGKVALTYLVNLPINELIARVKSAPERSVILYVRHSQDKPGNILNPRQILALIAQSANVPVYGIASGYLGNGIVGGHIFKHEDIGARLAEIGLRIANGGRTQDIPIENNATVPEFDWRQLRRWGISEGKLPPGSVVRFKDPTFWEQYRRRIIAVLALIVAQTLLIAFLYLEGKKRQRATRELRESEQRFSKTFHSSPQPMSITTFDEGRYIDINDRFLEASGYTREEVIGHTSFDLHIWENTEARNELVKRLMEQGIVRNLETKFGSKQGSFRDFLSSAELIELSGQQCILVASSDITERKRAEEQLSLLQTITMEVAAARDLSSALEVVLRRVCEKTGWALGQVWLPSQDGTVLDCGPAWFSSTNALDKFRVVSEACHFPPGVGLPGRVWSSKRPEWLQDVTADANFPRLAVAAEMGLKAALGVPIQSGEKFIAVIEFFLREARHEDEQLVKVITAVATQLDMVIERKLAEEALLQSEEALRQSHDRIEDLAGRLIVAQEEERKHLARELHDDLNQELVGLAIGISRLKRQYPDADANIQEQIATLRDKAKWLSERIRQMSHELHSSILQLVGLAAALRSYCTEFSVREGIAVALHIQDDLEAPENIALCLYRVTQESLRNTARHSGAKSATITLAEVNHSLELRVADQGAGFDPDQAKERRGLGLVSMEERVRLLRGSFELKSKPGVGTELKVRISLNGGL